MAAIDLFDKLAKQPTPNKAAVVIFLAAALGGGYYFLYYQDLIDQQNSVAGELSKLKEEKLQYEKRKAEYVAYRKEVNQLLEEQKELLRALPKKSEIPSFLEGIHSQAELVGLNIVSFIKLGEQMLDLYAKIPVAMEVEGTYHQINRFFKNVGDLKRIVNIEDISLARPAVKDGQVRLGATFVAATYRFRDAAKDPAPGAPK